MTATESTVSHADAGHAEHGLAHVMPPATLLATFAVLIVLTVVTVAASTLGLGVWEVWITLGIATAKGSLVALYFMHLRYDRPFHALVVIFGLMFVFLFLGLAIMDSAGYQPDVNAFVEKS